MYPSAAHLIFVVIAASDTQQHHLVLIKSHSQGRLDFAVFLVWTPPTTSRIMMQVLSKTVQVQCLYILWF